jgi:SAM-dependent methyltransferase
MLGSEITFSDWTHDSNVDGISGQPRRDELQFWLEKQTRTLVDMTDDFSNVYADPDRAAAYASLEFPGTYYLAYRDIPAIIQKHVAGTNALDFGCGAGRSTRFLRNLGYNAMGVDISSRMIDFARQADPKGTYICIADGDFSLLQSKRFDLILSVMAFDNIPGVQHRADLLRGLRYLLNQRGRIVLLVSDPAIYMNERASFTTSEFPENKTARSGEQVKVIMTDVADRRPVIDLIWYSDHYDALFEQAGLQIEATYRPLGKPEEPFEWISETTIPPWVIYVLAAR